MQNGWQILSALRSDSREWPIRIGVGGVGPGVAEENGLGDGGERRRRTWLCTSACVVVTLASDSGVMPDQLCEISGVRC